MLEKKIVCAFCVYMLADASQHIFGKKYMVIPCSAYVVKTPILSVKQNSWPVSLTPVSGSFLTVLISCGQATESPEEPLRKIPCLVLLLHVRVRNEG